MPEPSAAATSAREGRSAGRAVAGDGFALAFGVDEEGQPRTKIMRDANYDAILVADAQIDRFRRELEVENLERLYAARKPLERGPAAQAIWQLGQPRKPLVGHRKAKKSRSIKQRAA